MSEDPDTRLYKKLIGEKVVQVPKVKTEPVPSEPLVIAIKSAFKVVRSTIEDKAQADGSRRFS